MVIRIWVLDLIRLVPTIKKKIGLFQSEESFVEPEDESPFEYSSPVVKFGGLPWWLSSLELVRVFPDLDRTFTPIGNGTCKEKQGSYEESEGYNSCK